MKALFITLLQLIVCITQVHARLSFRTFDVKSGISDNYVQSILRDQYGFMWFATLNGLNRYDGYQCKRYTTIQLGTYNNCVNTIAEDASGIIWLKTPQYYFFYNRELDKIDSDIHSQLSPLGIEGKVEMLCVDNEQNLWCTTDNRLYYYVYKEKRLHQMPLIGKKTLVVTAKQSHHYILFADGEIAQINWKAKTIQKECQAPASSSGEYRMYMDTQFRLWIYTIYASNIQCYDTGNQQWVHFAGEELLENDFAKSVIDDGQGNIWIGTNSKGIYILNNRLNEYTSIHRDDDTPFSLPSNHINCFYKDSQEIMWVGTSKQGVAFTCLDNISFEICRTPEQEDISCIQEDEKGYLWLGFDGKGLVRYDKKRHTYQLFNTSNSNIPSNLIIGSYLDTKGRMWFGSYGSGVFYEQNGTFHSISYPMEKSDENPISYTRHIIEDKEGNLWMGTFMNGLYCMDSKGKFTTYTQTNSCLQTNSIMGLSHSNDYATLYIGTSTGLYKMDVLTKRLTQINGESEESSPLNKIHVNCLHRDQQGLLWIGTRSGIYIYEEKRKKLTHLSTDDGISHAYIRRIAEDHNKDIWLTTDRGITHIISMNDSSTNSFQFRCYPYFEEDGIGNIAFNNYSVYCNRKGNILIGGTGKYLKIYPELNKVHPNKHKVIFTGLYLTNQRIDVGNSTHDGRVLLDKNILLLDKIIMNYSDNNFALEVSAMDYGAQHKLQFAYRMGSKEEWVKLEGNRIYFNKLSPGIYRLQVKVNEPIGNQAPISTLIIQVRPPFWLSTTAYILYSALLIIGTILLLKKMLHKHQRILQQQKRDLETAKQHEMDEAKMRFFTNVSHDLRTPLSLIITPIEKLLHSESTQAFKDDLALIHRNASTLLDEVNQLLDFRKLDQQKTTFSPSYGNLPDFIADVCMGFNALSQKKGVSLQINMNTPKIEMDFDCNKMQRIIFNLLSNAIKYNHENGSVTVTIDKILTNDGERARIRIADTGIGIRDENKEKIFDRFFQEQHKATTYMGSGIGLHIVKEYVSLHGGEVKVENNHPKGSIFIITLPITRIPQITPAEDTSSLKTEESSMQKIIEPSKTEKASLLVVEDNDDFREFLISCLKEYYVVFDAPDGKEALSILSQQQIQIIISDVMMPVMDGMKLCHKVKTDIRYSHIPIILLTARTTEEHILSGLREGADEYITKPFNLEILLLRIHKMLMWTRNNHEKFKTIDLSPSEITISTLDEQLIEKAVRIIEQNMDNSEFTVEEFSSQVGMSRSGLYKKLMQITGKSPLEFMRILRLKRGRKLLEESQLSVSQIAYQVGLSPKQFAKFFKEEFSYLPSEYKKKQETTEE